MIDQVQLDQLRINTLRTLSIDAVQKAQSGSRCTGHPEYGWTSGVETTTGPLGQGVATSVGLSIAERWLAATYNRPGYEVFSHRVYVLCSDGDMMEGISSEAASLAGHLKLSNLCWIYVDYRISIGNRVAGVLILILIGTIILIEHLGLTRRPGGGERLE